MEKFAARKFHDGFLCQMRDARNDFALDDGSPDDPATICDLGLVQRAKRCPRLLLARMNLKAQSNGRTGMGKPAPAIVFIDINDLAARRDSLEWRVPMSWSGGAQTDFRKSTSQPP